MARIARFVFPGVPHHITQRGNRRAPVFFEDGDQLRYLGFLKEGAEKSKTAIWAWCLMPNHVHIIAVPSHADGLRALLADAHRRYTTFVNRRHGWTGHLWQGRFGSVAMDEAHLASALRYVALNPVRAGLAATPRDWPFSSAHFLLNGERDPVADTAPVLSRFPEFAALLDQPARPNEFDDLRKGESNGRPLGTKAWLKALEVQSGRRIPPDMRGRWPRKQDQNGDSLLLASLPTAGRTSPVGGKK